MKKEVVRICIFLMSCLMIQSSSAIFSFVYNLRIAEITKRQALEKERLKGPFLETVTVVDQIRKKYDGTHQNGFGALESFLCFSENMYARFDWAVAHVQEHLDAYHFSRTQTDDILCSFGLSHAISDRTRFTISGLTGIPTHKDTAFQGVEFGTGHFSLGVQGDSIWLYSPDKNHSIRSAVRYFRFFARSVSIPSLAPYTFKFNIGNLTDLYIAHHSKFGQHRFEFGYNPSFVWGTSIKPFVLRVVDATHYIRSNVYASYQYYFLLAHYYPTAFATAVSYGFDHVPKLYGFKNIITVWGAWGINF